MKILKRLFGELKPLNTSHELELLRIAEMDVMVRIDKQSRGMAQAYLDNKLSVVIALANLNARAYEELIICLTRTEECRAKLLHEREAPKSTKLDYTRYDANTY